MRGCESDFCQLSGPAATWVIFDLASLIFSLLVNPWLQWHLWVSQEHRIEGKRGGGSNQVDFQVTSFTVSEPKIEWETLFSALT